MVQWFIGCSGFHYKHWKGIFYPDKLAQTKWFDYYCQHFNTLELNVTFYRFPQLSFLETWYKKSPAKFKFAVKAPKAITHYKKFNDTERMLSDFYNTIEEGLKDKLGCVLFQMPPRYNYTPEKLDKVINAMNPAFNNVLEFRHSSWWNFEVYNILAKNKITFSGMSHPDLPDELVKNTSVLYYRMHGVQDLYASLYSISEIRTIINEIKNAGKIKKAFIYFNNDINVSAVKNAIEMIDLVK